MLESTHLSKLRESKGNIFERNERLEGRGGWPRRKELKDVENYENENR